MSFRECDMPADILDGIEIIRSGRSTIGLEIRADGRVIVRAPRTCSTEKIRLFVEEHRSWLLKHQKKMQEKLDAQPDVEQLSEDEIKKLAKLAVKIIPERVRYYAPLVGVTYGRITIRSQRSRWGSCSSKGNLNFNCLLMLTPPEVLDSVVVHELCHRKQMNHSQKFYAEVYRVFPEYDKWDRWLKENGSLLMRRLTG